MLFMTTPQLLGLAEVAELYSISKNSANAWVRRHDFPAPVAKLAMGPVWDREQVLAWRRPVTETWVSSKDGRLKFAAPESRCEKCGGVRTLIDDTLQVVVLADGANAAILSTCNCGSAQVLFQIPKEDQ
jgi:hypothetical protein